MTLEVIDKMIENAKQSQTSCRILAKSAKQQNSPDAITYCSRIFKYNAIIERLEKSRLNYIK